MLTNDKTQLDEIKVKDPVQSYEKETIPMVRVKLIDREIGSLRSNYIRSKIYLKNTHFQDKEIGSLRSNFVKIKLFFNAIFRYIKSFFTREKLEQIKAVFTGDFYNYDSDKNPKDNSVDKKERLALNIK